MEVDHVVSLNLNKGLLGTSGMAEEVAQIIAALQALSSGKLFLASLNP